MTDPAPRALPSGSPRGAASWVGLLGAAPLAVGLYFVLAAFTDLPPRAAMTAALATLMGVLWITEALPLAATSLLPLVLFPLCDVLPFPQAAAPYVNDLIYVYFGGFLLALAIERWELHRRIALYTLLTVGTSPAMLVGGIMLATALLSMWISNTATTAMMLPLGISLVALLTEHARAHPDHAFDERGAAGFATCMMLAIAYSATIGGLGTLIGTPTNAQLAAVAQQNGIEIGFARWMLFATPMAAVFLLLCWILLAVILYRLPHAKIPGADQMIRRELGKLGPLRRGELVVAIVFGLTALGWLVREPLSNWSWFVQRVPTIKNLNDGMIALAGALVLFAIPIDRKRGVFALDWETTRRMPWGVLLLFGGGLSLAAAVKDSQLAEEIGTVVAYYAGSGQASTLVLMLVVVTLVIFASEFTSNVATAAAVLPIMIGIAAGLDADPVLLLVPAALAASCAFMLPVGTPPNAIVFGSGYIRQSQMMAAGWWLNLIGIVLIPLAVYTLGAWVLGIKV
jgi:sodium-dependent dicarboxylate transporter 2/3/5